MTFLRKPSRLVLAAVAVQMLLSAAPATAETKAECRRRVKQQWAQGCFRVCRSVPSIGRGLCRSQCRRGRAQALRAVCSAL